MSPPWVSASGFRGRLVVCMSMIPTINPNAFPKGVVNIGAIEVPFKRLLQLGPGAVLQLDKPIGQPADLYVQDIKFATGDIVVVDGQFAVRMKEVFGAGQEEAEAPAK